MEKGDSLLALAMLKEAKVLKEENIELRIKANALDKVMVEIGNQSRIHTLEGVVEGSIESFQNASVQDVLFSMQNTIQKEMQSSWQQ